MERRVYLIDDDSAIRESLSFLLSTQNLAVSVYESAVEFLQRVGELPAGCVVTDLRMPDVTGLQLVRMLKDRGVDWPVIVMTGHGDVPLAVEAMKAGVVDFLEKPFSDDVILDTIESAFARLDVKGQTESERAAFNTRIATLTGREREVMAGLVAGSANKVIASDLGISARTVEIYRANVMTKMQARSLSELVRMALVSGAF